MGIVVVGLGLLRGVQLENMLPLQSDDVGYINFQHSTLSDQQIDAGLKAVGDNNNLEIFQLSGTVGTREVKIISRGTNQPDKRQSVPWLRPNKTGTISSAADNPDTSRSGIYALKGPTAGRAELEKWLSDIEAIATWERFTLLQTYFLPLSYQGVILILVVAVFLIVASIFSWFVARAPSRIVRLSAGHSRIRIVGDDSLSLLRIFLSPTLITISLLLGGYGLLKGRVALQLVVPVCMLLCLSFLLLIVAVSAVSFLTFPSIADWVNRRPLVSGFYRLSLIAGALAMIFSLSVVPVVYRSLLISHENRTAAEQAKQLPEYYALSFGGIVDESRDYDPFVQPFYDLVKTLDQVNQVALFHKSSVGMDPDYLLSAGYGTLLVLNPKAFNDLKQIAGGCELEKQSAQSIGDLFDEEFFNDTFILPEVKPAVQYYTCQPGTQAIAVEYQGIFSASKDSLILVVPNLYEALSSDTLMAWATTGAVLFSDPQTVVEPASHFGLNLTVDSTADAISIYAEDQNLGYFVNLFSFAALLLTMLLSAYTSASIYATAKIRHTFPLYLSGISIFNLICAPLLFDLIVIILGTFAATALGFALDIKPPILLIAAVGLGMILAVITIRYRVMCRALVHVCQRKN